MEKLQIQQVHVKRGKETKAVNVEGKHLVGPDWIDALYCPYV